MKTKRVINHGYVAVTTLLPKSANLHRPLSSPEKGMAASFQQHLSLKFLKRHPLLRSLQQPQATVLQMTLPVHKWQATNQH